MKPEPASSSPDSSVQIDSTPASSDLPAARRQEGWSKTRYGFNTNDFVVYPAHGVGQILAIEEQVVAGANLEFFVIYFAKSKMTLRAPTRKAIAVGMRQLSDDSAIERARRTLSQPSRKLRGSWARVAQEYESKLKSGDIVAVAEVMRDLYQPAVDTGQSYSERQLYALALDRLSGEVALVDGITDEAAVRELESLVNTSRAINRRI